MLQVQGMPRTLKKKEILLSEMEILCYRANKNVTLIKGMQTSTYDLFKYFPGV